MRWGGQAGRHLAPDMREQSGDRRTTRLLLFFCIRRITETSAKGSLVMKDWPRPFGLQERVGDPRGGKNGQQGCLVVAFPLPIRELSPLLHADCCDHL